MCLAISGNIVDICSNHPNTEVVEVVGVRRNVNLGFLQHNPRVAGEWVLIHVGFAMSRISEDAALDRMRTLRMLGEREAAMQEVKGDSLEEQS
jgi:hydrogenase expression/formation protein HypC